MRMIIFDMDGTLINSGHAIANTVNYVRENLGLEKFEHDFILEHVNDININSAEFFYNQKEFTPLVTNLFEEYYNQNCLNDLVIYDGIKDILDDFKNDFKFCIATNANSNAAKKMLSHLEIERYFSTILGYNDVAKPKPNPDMVNVLLDKYNTKKDKTKLIGDSNKDIAAAKKAGIEGILVNWGFSDHKKDALKTVCELRKKIENEFLKA